LFNVLILRLRRSRCSSRVDESPREYRANARSGSQGSNCESYIALLISIWLTSSQIFTVEPSHVKVSSKLYTHERPRFSHIGQAVLATQFDKFDKGETIYRPVFANNY